MGKRFSDDVVSRIRSWSLTVPGNNGEIPVRAIQTRSETLKDKVSRASIKYARDLGGRKSRATTTELVPFPGMLVLLLLAACTAAPRPTLVEPVKHDLPAVDGECFLAYRLSDDNLYISNGEECEIPTAPASTFKVPHALIALSTGVIPDATTLQKWDGRPQPFKSWERDHSLDSAIKSSVLWFFRRTAAAIGPDRMKEWLNTFQYCSDTFDGDPTYFWLNGDLVVSPREQLDFLNRMFRYQLLADRRFVDIVTTAMTMPPGKISNAAGLHDFPLMWGPDAVVRAKTGNTRVGDERVSWLIGRVTAGTNDYVFVSRIRSDRDLSTTAGAEIALRHLNLLR